MKRFTKALGKELLKDDNYNEALAYFCERLMNAKDKEEELYRIDEKLFSIACEIDDFNNDYTGNEIRIFTALESALFFEKRA